VAALIIMEKDEGTLAAMIVSPLKTPEYLASKVITLTALAILESTIMVGVVLLIMGRSAALPRFDAPMLLAGTAATGILYTLVGIVMSVRYSSITDMIVPLITIGMVFQLPFLHFLGLLEHALFLVVPTSAPAVLMQGAFRPAAGWEWAYGVGYTALWTAVLAYWAYASFKSYVVMRMG
jgi:fluoroquinolone transport system permease protein